MEEELLHDSTAPEDQQQQELRQPHMHERHRQSSISSLDESSQSQKPIYRNPSHPIKTLEILDEMRKDRRLTDVTLIAGDVTVYAHKTVLASSSQYFYAMFLNPGFEEGTSNSVTLGGEIIDPLALQALVDYVYTARVRITEENVQSLLPAANILQIHDVRDFCCEFLTSQLHPTNCLGIKRFADLHGCLDLLEYADKFIESHFTEVLETDEFFALSVDQVASLISSDTITVSSEEKIFESAIAWINHDLESRQHCLPKLMEYIRLPLLSLDYLFRIEDNPLIKLNMECKDYIIEALKFHLSQADVSKKVSIVSTPRTKPREPIGLPKVMLAIGGQAPKAVRSVECYDFKTDEWSYISEMSSRRCRCGVAVVRGKVYAVGGFNGSLRVKSVVEYDSDKDTWTPIAEMEARRSTLGVAVLNDRIYAIGGFDGSSGLNSAEVLDLKAGGYKEWRNIASMSTRRSSVGVGVLNGYIYAVGGYDGNSRQCLSSVEVYNPDQDTWNTVCEMGSRRSGAGVGILHDLLYAIGGHDGPLVRKSVECYEPETGVWKNVSDMNHCRRNAGVVTHGGFLYVVGGDDGTSNLQSMEMYNPETDTWTVLEANLILGRSYTGVCVIDKPDSL